MKKNYKLPILKYIMKNKKRAIIFSVIAVVLITGILIFNFYPKKSTNNEENGTEIKIYNKVGLANPSSTYCGSLGYKYEIGTGEQGASICIFPDKTKCEAWKFFRGKCGQEWSYCKLKGYDLKNLTLREGWGPDGSICLNKTTQEEIGNVYDLINNAFELQNK